MRIVGVSETESEDVLITPWSATHLIAGIVAKNTGISLLEWNLVHAAYEGKDILLQQEVKNSLVNSVGDQVSANVGYVLPIKIGMFWSLALFAGTVTGLSQYEYLG